MGLASPVESLPVNGAEVGVTDDEVVDGAASRDMDFKLSRRGNRSGGFILPRTNTNRYKTSFLPSALLVFSENYSIH